jgi:hypothetical protein
MRVHTLRGRVDASTTKRLVVDDGRFTHVMKVVEFYVWSEGLASGDDPECLLAKNLDIGPGIADASNGNQIAWAGMRVSSTAVGPFSIVDPDHLVISDLYISNISAATANYLIVMKDDTITEDEAVLQLIKERAQDDLR